MLLLHAEVCTSVFYEHVHFLETSFVEQHGYALAGCIFTFIMLFGNRFFATTQACSRAAVDKLFNLFKLITHLT